jgi:isopentenyl phosphate kinase
MEKLILIKLGGSLITDKAKPFSAKLNVINRLAKEIHSVRKNTESIFIIGHGGGSYPHTPARKYKTHLGIINKGSYRGIAEVQDAAARLNRIVVSELIKAGENAMSLSPSSFMVGKSQRIEKAFMEPILYLLRDKILPVVYGDVLLDSEKGCMIASTEMILNYLAINLKKYFTIEKIVYLGNTNGVYDSSGNTIPKINGKNFEKFRKDISGSAGIDVTGGMLHKVEESLELAIKHKIITFIINGQKERLMENFLGGKKVEFTRIED